MAIIITIFLFQIRKLKCIGFKYNDQDLAPLKVHERGTKLNHYNCRPYTLNLSATDKQATIPKG